MSVIGKGGEVKNWSKLLTDNTKILPTWGRGVSKIQKICQHVYGWSLRKEVTNPYRTMSFCLGCLSCSASSSSLFMTLVASELPEVPSDLSPVLLEFDKQRGSDRPKHCFTVLPKPNQTSQLKFCFPNRN